MSGDDKFDLDSYVSVSDRIVAFREANPEGVITTSIETERSENGAIEAWTAYTRIWKHRTDAGFDQVPDSDGTARQIKLAAPPKTRNGKDNIYAPEWSSPVETVETSAIGRALANLGYETTTEAGKAKKRKRPSREEIRSARTTAESDPHERAWSETIAAVGVDRAEGIFLAALRSAGIPKIRTAEEYEAVTTILADTLGDHPEGETKQQ